LVFLGDSKPLQEALARIGPAENDREELKVFAKLTRNATPDLFRPVSRGDRFAAIIAEVSSRPDGSDAAELLTAVVGPPRLVPTETIVQLLLGTKISAAYLEKTARFAPMVAVDENVFARFQCAIASLLRLQDPPAQIIATITPEMTRFLEANSDSSEPLIHLPATEVCRFVLGMHSRVPVAILDFFAACAGASGRFAAEMEKELLGMPRVSKTKFGWGLMGVRIAMAQKITDSDRFERIETILRNMVDVRATEDSWTAVVTQIYKLCQRMEAQWIGMMWKRMLVLVPGAVLAKQKSKAVFEEIFRELDHRIGKPVKEQFVSQIAKLLREQARDERLGFLASVWPWSSKLVK
jgi:hypothetical protein